MSLVMNKHSGKIKKTIIICFFIIILSTLSVQKETIADSSKNLSSQDNFFIYDRSETFLLANITFKAEIIQNNSTFTIIQFVEFETISTPLTADWGIEYFYFATELIYGSWFIDNDTYERRITIPLPVHSEVKLKPGENITLIENVTASSNWNGEDFRLRPAFRSLEFLMKNGTNVPFSKYVNFWFDINGAIIPPVINGKMVLENFKVNPWIALNTNLKYLYLIVLLILFAFLIIIFEKIISACKKICRLKKITKQHISVEELTEISKISQQVGWLIIDIFAIATLFISIQNLKGVSFNIWFFLTVIFGVLLIYVVTYIIRRIQLSRFEPQYYHLVRSGTISQITELKKNMQDSIAKYPFKEIILLILGAFITQILPLITGLFI